MGYGSYSGDAYNAIVQKRASTNIESVFQQSNTHPLMNPKGVKLRESRDSQEHPHTTSIVFALDVTGSMGGIPKALAQGELPKFMKVLSTAGVADPQVMFMSVGDAYSDRAPLQVGQFESTGELMDQWLTRSFLEGAGGGQGSETYELALYFLATHTETDGWIKRKKRGYVFLTGDEFPYDTLPPNVVETVIGDRLTKQLTVEDVIAEVQTSYEVFFIIPHQPASPLVEERWRKLLGEHVIRVDGAHEVCFAAAGITLLLEKRVADFADLMSHLGIAGLHPESKNNIARALSPIAARCGIRHDGILSKLATYFGR